MWQADARGGTVARLLWRRAAFRCRYPAVVKGERRPALAQGLFEGEGVELEWHEPPVAAGAGDIPGASAAGVVGLTRNDRAWATLSSSPEESPTLTRAPKMARRGTPPMIGPGGSGVTHS